MTEARVLFAGTPAFAEASLRAMVEAGVRPLAVYTQPDRPKGRGRKLATSPVKDYALGEGIDVHQPVSLKAGEEQERLRALQPDLIVVAAYGLIFPQAVLDIPRLGCVNIHASLLPRWRGAAPIQAAIVHGDPQTGISLMQMEAGLDSGPVFARAAIDIGAGETAGELHDRMATLGGVVLADKLPQILAGELMAEPQDEAGVTHAGKIQSADAELDWRRSAIELERIVRGYNPVPGARFTLDDEAIKCWRAQCIDSIGGPAGRVLAAGRDGVDIACGEGALRLLEVQRPGRRRISGEEFARQLPLAGRDLVAA